MATPELATTCPIDTSGHDARPGPSAQPRVRTQQAPIAGPAVAAAARPGQPARSAPHVGRCHRPAQGSLLEVACGSGQHAAHFAAALPQWRWQPSDPSAAALASTALWCTGLANVAPACLLDVQAQPWPVPAQGFDAVFCANLLHISPWASCAGLMQGASRCLAPGGRLLVYGPFVESGVDTAPSNLAFDADLRARNPAWGLRPLQSVVDVAAQQALRLLERVNMPANNLLLVFGR
jgi:SAM-dependent methyltransferase